MSHYMEGEIRACLMGARNQRLLAQMCRARAVEWPAARDHMIAEATKHYAKACSYLDDVRSRRAYLDHYNRREPSYGLAAE